jgi:quercetin dioxygenase-like cupin family protein
MGKSRFVDATTITPLRSRDAVSPRVAAYFTEDDADGEIRVHHRGSEDALQLFEVTVPPNEGASPHAHEQDEIMYVLSGQLRFGARVVEAGSSVYIEGGTLYSFLAGPGGAVFLNFRPRLDASFITKDQLMERRQAQA